MLEKNSVLEWNANTVKALRRHLECSLAEMSEYLGISEKLLLEWEIGQSRPENPDRTQLNMAAMLHEFPYRMRFDETPLDVVALSSRAHNSLHRAGYQTVEQVAILRRKEILAIRNVGERSLLEIEDSLKSYLPRYPLPARPAKPMVKKETPVEALDLTRRSQNCLLRANFKTVEQLVDLSDEDLLAIPNLGWKSLVEIKNKLEAYLREHPVVDKFVESFEEPQPFLSLGLEDQKLLAPPPLAVPEVLETVRKRNVPLMEIPLARLELANPSRQMLRRAGIETIGALAWQPYDKWGDNRVIRERLDCYLSWLVEQDETTWTEEAADQGISLFHRLTLAKTTLELLMKNWFADLTPRQQHIIQWRYGLYSEPLTLEEIGEQHLGLTRERVRQIQAKAENRLSHYTRRQRVQPLVALLRHLLKDAGGLMSKTQIGAVLRRELLIGDVDPAGVVRLIGAVYSDFKWLRKTQAWGLTDYPLKEVNGIQKRLVRVLEKGYAPLSVNEVIKGFKASRFYRSREDGLDDHFIDACLRVHPGIVIDKDGLYSLKKWESRRTDEIVLALREIGEPAHYSEIAETTNRLLEPDMRTSAHNILAILGRRSDLFVRVGHGVYALKAWGLPDDGSVANAASRVLREAGKPLHIDTITDGVLETWQVRRGSVYVAVKNDSRFLHIGPGMYELRERLSGQVEPETEADFGDLFGDRLSRWQADFDDQQSADLDTHAEVDAIRDIGLDFFSD